MAKQTWTGVPVWWRRLVDHEAQSDNPLRLAAVIQYGAARHENGDEGWKDAPMHQARLWADARQAAMRADIVIKHSFGSPGEVSACWRVLSNEAAELEHDAREAMIRFGWDRLPCQHETHQVDPVLPLCPICGWPSLQT